MELTQEIIFNDMHKIKGYLALYGLTDVVIEYPGFLSILSQGREIHAGYSFDYDEKSDGEMFQVYDFTDGVNGETWTIANDGNLEDLARTIATVLNA